MRRLIIVGIALGVLFATAAVSAHPWDDWYSSRWRTGTYEGVNQDQTVDWRFVDNFTGPTWRDSVQAGSAKWNAENTPMTFHFESAQSDYNGLSWDSCPSNYQADRVGRSVTSVTQVGR
jgi:hypothetical protein